jgi:3-oxoacyl-[acyl-carrier-protein] synthase-1
MGLPLGISALGIASPIGIGKAAVAQTLARGTRAGLVRRADLASGRSIYVGAVTAALPPVAPELSEFDCRNNRLMLLALNEILDDVRGALDRYQSHRIAVILGTSTAGIAEAERAYAQRKKTGIWPLTFGYRQQETGNLAEFAARALGITGPAYTIATACSSTGKVFASARRLIEMGVCDAAVVGGADTLSKMTINGFCSLEAVSDGYCNPFSINRDGVNIGEAAAAFLLTRDQAAIHLQGVGESSDAYHMSAPEPEGRGALDAMRGALSDAGIFPADIAYINLHGTATPLNDAMEGRAVNSLFGPKIPCSSTKGMTGHTLGAAGACEAAFLWLTLHPDYNSGRLPPHVWDNKRDPSIPEINLAPPATRIEIEPGRTSMLSNSFAFGGNNVAIVMGRSLDHA